MSGPSSIEWTQWTWNPVVGCTRVTDVCQHCFAFALHDRRHAPPSRARYPVAATHRTRIAPGSALEPVATTARPTACGSCATASGVSMGAGSRPGSTATWSSRKEEEYPA